jgi:hypothetical protein
MPAFYAFDVLTRIERSQRSVTDAGGYLTEAGDAAVPGSEDAPRGGMHAVVRNDEAPLCLLHDIDELRVGYVTDLDEDTRDIELLFLVRIVHVPDRDAVELIAAVDMVHDVVPDERYLRVF